MQKIFWRSREGLTPPPKAQFSIWSFAGHPLHLNDTPILSHLPAPSTVRALQRVDTPDRETWLRSVEQALAEIERGHLQKVVLARETALHLDQAPDPFAIASSLERKAQGACLFCLQLGENRAFLGATPERLFHRSQRTITAEAIAGTRRRGSTEQESRALGAELLRSKKERREFQFVQDYFEKTLQSCCSHPLVFSPTGLHRTANVQHLISTAVGDLTPHCCDQSIVQMLHPSPALCGTPKQRALDWIRTHEAFRRGFYGGIIGWQTDEEADWMVAIRCCMLEGPYARIYTGTGIVAGSDPEKEWEELEAKLALYDEIFACGH